MYRESVGELANLESPNPMVLLNSGSEIEECVNEKVKHFTLIFGVE